MSSKALYRGTQAAVAVFIVGCLIYGIASDVRDFHFKRFFEWVTAYILPWIVVVQLALILIRLNKK